MLSRIFQFKCFVQFRSTNVADAAFECVQRRQFSAGGMVAR